MSGTRLVIGMFLAALAIVTIFWIIAALTQPA